jgi:CHAT domain-containing protein
MLIHFRSSARCDAAALRPVAGRLGGAVIVVAALCGGAPSFAATFEEIQAACRESVGKPIVQSCMQAQGKGGDIEACRAKATPAVRACVQKEASKAAAGKAPPPAPVVKEAAPKGAGGVAAAIFVAPPRTIADITAILEQEKPDPAKIAKLKADADAQPPKGGSPKVLAQFYNDRGNARAALGRTREALADGEKALAVAKGATDPLQVSRIRQFIGIQHNALGDPKKAVESFQTIVREGSQEGGKRGTMINPQRNIAGSFVLMGDVSQAEAYIRRNVTLVQDARGSPHPNWRKSYEIYGRAWEADADEGKALILEARGQYKEAEAALVRGEAFRRAQIQDLPRYDFPPPREQVIHAAARDRAALARVKARQGRLSEAEADARRALLEVLNTRGKYHPVTVGFINGLTMVLVEQGRYPEAEQLTRAALDIQRTLGIGDDTQTGAMLLSQLGGILNLQRKLREAAAVYAELDKAIANWEPQRREEVQLKGARIYSLYATGQIAEGLAAAQALLAREIKRVGDKHFDTAAARGVLAVGYMRSGRDAEALREFRAAIPVMMTAAGENADDDDTTVVAARRGRVQNVVEPYMQLVAKLAPEPGRDVAAETFTLAEAIRGRSVQQALASSSARMVAKDAALAELVRKEQDLAKQINAQLGALNNALALPSSERDESAVQAINAAIEKDRAERSKAKQEIARRFPSYADLVEPKPPTVEQIKATLAPGEAFLSFYFGRDASFVWAVPKDGPVAFATVNAKIGELESKIRKLREALEPQAAMISDIPAFDVALGYEVYSLLLKPVERGWKSAKSLVVVTNGALGLLPLSLLPTAPVKVAASDELFAGYRNVPWLARTHAVSMVPSAAALRTLRQLPPGKPLRNQLIAFGDPYFSDEQAKEADALEGVQLAAANVTRGIPLARRNSPKLEGVDSAELALLPRLPDTADELKAIALTLQADPSKVLNLGKQANEKIVKSLDLSGFKVVAFATHGLVPGELNGLSQPALALSAPSVAGIDGDGLLTMEEILALKLDADWVVLSACNTGAGAGAGAEAASGLGRAFFYAGTRALLVTNWSVHSQSARELVTDMFKRQADDASVTRAEALRRAMTALIDGKGYTDEQGKTQFAYAHPLFWAPYTIIGDGGRR